MPWSRCRSTAVFPTPGSPVSTPTPGECSSHWKRSRRSASAPSSQSSGASLPSSAWRSPKCTRYISGALRGGILAGLLLGDRAVVLGVGEIDQRRRGARGPRRRRRAGHTWLAAPTMRIRERIEWGGGAEIGAGVVLDADGAASVRINDELNGLAGELVGDFKEPPCVGDGAIAAHQAQHAMVEEGIEPRGERSQETDVGQVFLVAVERGPPPETRMLALVIDRLHPGPQPRVELLELDRLPAELAQELIAQRPVISLQLALPLGRVRPAVDELDAQPRADPLERSGAISGAVVDDELATQAAFQHRLLEHPFDLERPLREAEGAVGDEARGIIHQRDQIRFAPAAADQHPRAM